jgi:hypothetical protein
MDVIDSEIKNFIKIDNEEELYKVIKNYYHNKHFDSIITLIRKIKNHQFKNMYLNDFIGSYILEYGDFELGIKAGLVDYIYEVVLLKKEKEE